MGSVPALELERASIGDEDLEICRMINGLWQRADVSAAQSDIVTASDIMNKT